MCEELGIDGSFRDEGSGLGFRVSGLGILHVQRPHTRCMIHLHIQRPYSIRSLVYGGYIRLVYLHIHNLRIDMYM